MTDRLFIKPIYPHLCAAVVIFECSKGWGRIVLSFSENCSQANEYTGRVLVLMALHLLLLSHIHLNWIGALNKIQHLLPQWIPSCCRHLDPMIFFVNCSFKRFFSHVNTHQDDMIDWYKVFQPAKLKCGCGIVTKKKIVTAQIIFLPTDIPSRTCHSLHW